MRQMFSPIGIGLACIFTALVFTAALACPAASDPVREVQLPLTPERLDYLSRNDISCSEFEEVVMNSAYKANIKFNLLADILKNFRENHPGESHKLYDWHFLLLTYFYANDPQFQFPVELFRSLPYGSFSADDVLPEQGRIVPGRYFYDPYFTHQKVLPWPEFSRICLESAARRGIEEKIITEIISEFQKNVPNKVMHPLEWRCLLPRLFYEQHISYKSAVLALKSLPLSPIDTGLLEALGVPENNESAFKSGSIPATLSLRAKEPVPVYEVIPPFQVKKVTPLYTKSARKNRIKGVVILDAIIRKDGSVDSLKIIRGLGYGLDEEVISTIKNKWIFKPATIDGNPIDFPIQIEVLFAM